MEHTIKRKVNNSDLAINLLSGDVKVLATPILAAAMEQAAAELAKEIINDNEKTTVGTEISIKHLAPTPEGMIITATATLTEKSNEGRILRFFIECFDEHELIGTAIHSRCIVNKQKFELKAQNKK